MGTSPKACKGFFLVNARCKIITINSDLPEEIRRIILAHELGHLVLQHGGGLQAEEREADVFASYLLCPRVAVTSLRAGRGDLVERVAHAFYVSLACARMALAQPEQQISADLTCQLSEQLKAAAAKIAERDEKTSPKTTNVFGKGL